MSNAQTPRPAPKPATVAFGMGALQIAYDAKAGITAGRGCAVAAARLRAAAIELVPGDPAVLVAVDRFAAGVAADPVAAGADLHDFLIDWDPRRPQAGAGKTVPRLFDWQLRRDCGHE